MDDLAQIEIVLVEDNPNDAELTIRELRRNNLANKLHWLKDGEEALNFFFKKHKDTDFKARPKVILLDIKLPKVNGLEVLEKLKEDDRTRHIPVVILTSSSEERDRYKGYDLGVNSYVVKPVDFEDFTHAIRDIGLYWVLLNKR